MSSTDTIEKVSHEFTTIDNGVLFCDIVVESPRVAELDPESEGLSDAIEALALATESGRAAVRKAHAESMVRVNKNPRCGSVSIRFVGRA